MRIVYKPKAFKLVYTKHALEKFKKLELEGWFITKDKIRRTIKNPKWKGLNKENQEIALSLVDPRHIIRIVFKREGGIIRVITFHLGRRGRYESTLR